MFVCARASFPLDTNLPICPLDLSIHLPTVPNPNPHPTPNLGREGRAVLVVVDLVELAHLVPHHLGLGLGVVLGLG